MWDKVLPISSGNKRLLNCVANNAERYERLCESGRPEVKHTTPYRKVTQEITQSG